MKIGITDIEGNNLYQDITLFHCSWIINPLTGDRKGYRPHQLEEYCKELSTYDVAVLHNGIDFDFPALLKLHGDFVAPPVFDTIVLSRLLMPDRIRGHSLKSWGIELGVLKGEYGEEENAWEVFTEDMFNYCEQDVEVTLKLFQHLCKLAEFDYTNPPKSLLNYHNI